MKKLPQSNLFLSGIALAMVMTTSTALGFDTECFYQGEPCSDGPGAARGQLTGDIHENEHSRIWRQTVDVAGLPDIINRPFTLRAVTGGETILIGDETHLSQLPTELVQAHTLVEQTVSLEEFAELADFSFSLWDRFSGNETCPIGSDLSSEECHGLKTHMGAVNSNHFLPQAYDAYRHYHELALAHAKTCKDASDAMSTENRAFHRDTLRACERMALTYEAFGQHFLQDAWSMGHMWERWGSPNREVMSDNFDAIAIGSVAGLIHGSTAVLQEELDSIGDFSDSLCAPVHEETQYKTGHTHEMAKGLGDLFLSEALDSVSLADVDGDSEFSHQTKLMLSCAAAGLLEVYEATGQQHGSANRSSQLLDVDATDEATCFGQRATNEAMKLGAGVDMVIAGFIPYHLDLDSYTATAAVVGIASQYADNYDDMSWWTYGRKVNQLRVDLSRIASLLELHAKLNPHGTESASGALGNLLDKLPNGDYSEADRLGNYSDEAPHRAGQVKTPAQKATQRWNREGFMAASCEEVAHFSFKQHLRTLKNRVNTASSAEEKAARCEACIVQASKVARPNQKEVSSLCGAQDQRYAPFEIWVDTFSTTPRETAGQWCGCN